MIEALYFLLGIAIAAFCFLLGGLIAFLKRYLND